MRSNPTAAVPVEKQTVGVAVEELRVARIKVVQLIFRDVIDKHSGIARHPKFVGWRHGQTSEARRFEQNVISETLYPSCRGVETAHSIVECGDVIHPGILHDGGYDTASAEFAGRVIAARMPVIIIESLARTYHLAFAVDTETAHIETVGGESVALEIMEQRRREVVVRDTTAKISEPVDARIRPQETVHRVVGKPVLCVICVDNLVRRQ